MKQNKNTKLVYSTYQSIDPGIDAPDVKLPLEGQTAYISCDRKGRRGKSVTVISGLKYDLSGLKKELQKLCGGGGSVKNGLIEIQGDQRAKIAGWFEKKGVRIKYKGG